MIPQLIHQIWFQGKDKMPDHLNKYNKSWIKNNPDYVVLVWDEKTIQKEVDIFFDPEVRDMYNSYPYMIQKIDLAKYIILYKYGGVYIDMDTNCLQRIKPSFFQNYDIIVSKLPYTIIFSSVMVLGGNNIFNDIINNGVIICSIQNKVILDTINEAKKNKNSIYKNINKALYVYVTTGPLCITNAVNKNKQDTNIKLKILDSSYFEPCNVFDIDNKECNIPEHSIGVHLYENSWISESDNFLKKLFTYIFKKIYIIISILIFLILLILYRKQIMKYIIKLKN